MCTWCGVERSALDVIPQNPFMLIFEAASLPGTWSLPVRLDWLMSKFQISSSLWFSSAGLQAWNTMCSFGLLGHWIQDLMLTKQVLGWLRYHSSPYFALWKLTSTHYIMLGRLNLALSVLFLSYLPDGAGHRSQFSHSHLTYSPFPVSVVSENWIGILSTRVLRTSVYVPNNQSPPSLTWLSSVLCPKLSIGSIFLSSSHVLSQRQCGTYLSQVSNERGRKGWGEKEQQSSQSVRHEWDLWIMAVPHSWSCFVQSWSTWGWSSEKQSGFIIADVAGNFKCLQGHLTSMSSVME